MKRNEKNFLLQGLNDDDKKTEFFIIKKEKYIEIKCLKNLKIFS